MRVLGPILGCGFPFIGLGVNITGLIVGTNGFALVTVGAFCFPFASRSNFIDK